MKNLISFAAGVLVAAAASAGGAENSLPRSAPERRVFPVNDQLIESVVLNSMDDRKSVKLAIERDGKSMSLPAGFREWRTGRTPLPGGRLARFPDEPVAGTFAWDAEDTVVIKVCAYETPFHVTFKLRFSGDTVTLDSEANVAFGPAKQGTLVGQSGSN